MGVREALNRYPSVTIGATALVMLLSIVLMLQQMKSVSAFSPPTRAFYTTDDGQTVFGDARAKIAPFLTDDGREAVLAHVMSCDGGKTRQILFLEKWAPEAKAYLENPARAGATTQPQWITFDSLNDHRLIKRPGDPKWYSASSPEAEAIIELTPCANGQPPLEVLP